MLERVVDSRANGTWGFLFEEIRAVIAAGFPELARRIAPDPDRFPRPISRADAEAAAAAFAEFEGRWRVAAEGYQRAVDVFERVGWGADTVGPLIGLGRCLIRLGELGEGHDKLRQARSVGEGLEAHTRVAEIDELLEAASLSEGGSA